MGIMKNLSLLTKQIIQVLLLIAISIATVLTSGVLFSSSIVEMADAFKTESYQSTELTLNIDRDLYQALSALSVALLQPAGSDYYKLSIDGVWTNINDVNGRIKELQALLENQPEMQKLRNETTNLSIKEDIDQFLPLFDQWTKSVDALVINYEKINDLSKMIVAYNESYAIFTNGRGHIDRIGETLVQYPDIIKNKYLANTKDKMMQVYFRAAIVFALALGAYIFILRRTIKKLESLANNQSQLASALRQASVQLSDAGQQLATGSNEQAASIEETSSSMEETLSMVKQNVENTRQTRNLSEEASDSSSNGSQKMEGLNSSMEELKRSSNEVSKIIKVIDEIAFQTNILALNAAVEAARAGDAGLGFAVVAEEVRNLAQRSAQAAKDTAVIIEKNIELSEKGLTVSLDVNTSLDEISMKTKNVNQLVAEIAAASEEQARGIGQVTTAISQMEKVIQQNAASAQESAATSEELLAQAEELESAVYELNGIIKGTKKAAESEERHSSKITKRKDPKTSNNSYVSTKYISPKDELIISKGNNVTKKHVVSPSDVIPLDDEDDF